MPPKKVNKTYIKMNPREHILTRPDMYVGSIVTKKDVEYIALKNEEGNYIIVKNEINFSPALLRIFVEVLSNAIDNVQRSKKGETPVTEIKININKITGETSVWNDGDIIPVELNVEEKIYNHSLIFGHLLTSSNYDDTEDRTWSGLNGVGIKIEIIFLKRGFVLRAINYICIFWNY